MAMNNWVILCGGAQSTASFPANSQRINLQLRGPEQNVRLKIEDVRAGLWSNIPDLLTDLLEVASYVFTADQACPRGQLRDSDAGAHWRRGLHFVIPVRCPQRWQQPRIRRALQEALAFVSEDEYSFHFAQCQESLGRGQRYFHQSGELFEGRVEEVALFSGGLDGLAGAAEAALLHRRQTLLVHHRPNPKREKGVTGLVRRLSRLPGAVAPLYVPVRVNKAKGLTRETTQRTRSFLFSSLAAVVARLLRRDSITFYENGIVGLNLPFATQLVGARASRTTHPRFLKRMADFLSDLFEHPFLIHNPYRLQTKGEVIQRLAEAGAACLIADTISCSHPRKTTQTAPHCGVCLQCVVRRFGVLAAQQGQHDPAEGYETDLLTGARDDSRDRTLLAAFTETARELAGLSPAAFVGRFGEVARLPHALDQAPVETSEQTAALYRRHGAEVLKVVRQGLQDHAWSLANRSLPKTCLLRMLVAGPTPVPVVAPAPAQNLFRSEGAIWRVRFRGGPTQTLPDSRGMGYLRLLIQQQGKQVSTSALIATVSCRPETSAVHGSDKLADATALAAYRQRYEELEADIAEARANNDLGQLSRLQEERQSLGEELARIAMPNGDSKCSKNDREQQRRNVFMAINRALKKIRMYMPELADHFCTPTLRRGNSPSYHPHPPVEWEV